MRANAVKALFGSITRWVEEDTQSNSMRLLLMVVAVTTLMWFVACSVFTLSAYPALNLQSRTAQESGAP